MVAILGAVWLGGVTALIFTVVRVYNELSRGPADVPAAIRGATISSPLYWTGVVLAFLAAFAFAKYWSRAALSLSLGLVLFVALGFFSVLVAVVRGPVTTSHATGVSAIFGATIFNPFFYLALLGCILIGAAIVGTRTTPVP
jgi:hypothetical protein